MSLQTRLSGLITAIGADIKALQIALVSVAKTGVDDAGLSRGSFFIYNTSGTLLGNQVETTIPLAGVSFDVSNGKDGTGYVIPVTGVYRFTAAWRCSAGLVSGTRVIVYIYVGGGGARFATVDQCSGADQVFVANGLAKCVAGQVVKMHVRQDTGGMRSTQIGELSTFLCGELVGRTT